MHYNKSAVGMREKCPSVVNFDGSHPALFVRRAQIERKMAGKSASVQTSKLCMERKALINSLV